MADSRCAMCGFPISVEVECNVTCEGPCRRVFHIACIVGSSVGSLLSNSKHWKCCNCRSLATSELASSALKSAFLPVQQSRDSPQNSPESSKKLRKNSPNMENLTNAVDFLGGQIDIFNKIVYKFKKRMDEFEKQNRELKNENEELKITVQALRKRVEAVENDQIFGHLDSSLDEINYSSGSGSFDIPEIAPGVFILPETVAEDLAALQLGDQEVLQLGDPEALPNGEEGKKVKFEIPETSPLGFEVRGNSEDQVPEMTSNPPMIFVVPESLKRSPLEAQQNEFVTLEALQNEFGELETLQNELETPETRRKNQEKLKVRFELPPPSPVGFEVHEDSGSFAEISADVDPTSAPTIVVVPPAVERKLRSALKPARKHFGNVVIRLMAEEYLSGADTRRRMSHDKNSSSRNGVGDDANPLKPVSSAPEVAGRASADQNTSKWGFGGRNVVAKLMAEEYMAGSNGLAGRFVAARRRSEDPSLGVVPGAGEMSSDPYRSRYGQLNSYTWGSHTAALREHERRQKTVRGDVVYHTVTGAVSQGSQRQHQVPSIFEIFRPRSKSDAASKKPLVGSAKNSLKSQSSTSSESGEHSRGPVAKVIHLFRNRSQSAASAEEKRKARAAALHQQQVAAHTAYLKGKNSIFGAFVRFNVCGSRWW
ncbi:hypothetical protein GE061_008162 [Apolygus lucorum]|uniref:Uncharacterized protein n=1 Tax=Apolygus lucorum TaxID=248454 RepID=A0A6A4IY97_APOLU|nr:hypothetical protein GE061_008162 [Apolygus lucorum]